MFSLLYNGVIFFIALVYLPKVLWQWWVLGKYRESLAARLGFQLPSFVPGGGEIIWIHAVSMGETRAVVPLYRCIQEAYPDAQIVISSTTETGHAESRRSMPNAAAHFFLPLDFSWVIRRFLKKIRPTTLILCESDFWYHLLKIAKEQGTTVCLVNGKVSENSCRRYQKALFFTRKLFNCIDLFCLQSERFRERFLALGVPAEKLIVTGNLKFDAAPQKMSITERTYFSQSLGIAEGEPVLVIGSTHAPEEEWILSAIDPLWKKIPNLKVLLVPRHPERFEEVAQKIRARGIGFARYSEGKSADVQLILIDAMGVLNHCYQIAAAAIVGGSFVAHIGGHNVFEPVLFGVPVLFGPHMHTQLDFKELVLGAKAGIETSIEDLPTHLLALLENKSMHNAFKERCQTLAKSVPGAAQRTFLALQKNKKK